MLIPEEKAVPPLAMVNHHVNIQITDQVALVIDTHDGKEKVDDKEIDKLFVAKK